MTREEFIKFIESIGFKYIEFIGIKYNDVIVYGYKEYIISLYSKDYDIYNGSEWIFNIKFNDLTPLDKIIRSYKLKNILGCVKKNL